MTNDYPILIKFMRNSLEETSHSGFIIHLNKSKILNKIGNSENIKFYQRSCSKPMQFSELTKNGYDKEFSEEEIAVCCASHTGTKEHQKHIRSVLNIINMTENNLLCPPDSPLDKNEGEYLLKNNLPVLKIHNNCSGKHSAMLALCRYEGYETKNYTDLNHPLTKLILNQISSLCETKDIKISKDGCTLPTFATTLSEIGKGFLNLFCSEKYERIRNSILKYPYLAGGEGRIDSEIINAGNGKLISKVGAGGIIVVLNLEKEEAIVVKISDASYLARSIVVIKTMLELGWLSNEQLKQSPLNDLYKTEIETETGEKVGEAEFCFSF